MAERIDLTLAEELAQLAEHRALLERIRQNRLEAEDWAVVKSLVSELIGQMEATGQESVTLELPPDDDDTSNREMNTRIGVDSSTAEDSQR